MSQLTLGALWGKDSARSVASNEHSLSPVGQPEPAAAPSPGEAAAVPQPEQDPAAGPSSARGTEAEPGEREAGPKKKRKSSEGGAESKRKCSDRYAVDFSKVPDLEKPHFDAVDGEIICKPCTWKNEQKGKRGNTAKVTVLVNTRDNVNSHLGTKVRTNKKEASQSVHQSNTQEWKEQLERQAVLQQQPSSGITAGLQAANMLGFRQKLVQFIAVNHALQHQRPMVAYEELGELLQAYRDRELIGDLPRKHWTDDSGLEIAEALALEVRHCFC